MLTARNCEIGMDAMLPMYYAAPPPTSANALSGAWRGFRRKR